MQRLVEAVEFDPIAVMAIRHGTDRLTHEPLGPLRDRLRERTQVIETGTLHEIDVFWREADLLYENVCVCIGVYLY